MTTTFAQHNDRSARPVWSTLLPNLPKLFQGLDIAPALMHGDLWGGNAAETQEGPGKMRKQCYSDEFLKVGLDHAIHPFLLLAEMITYLD